MRVGSTLYFLADDHLGGTSVVMNAASSLVNRVRYYPYGNIRTQEGGTPVTDRLFTGQRRLGDGIYNYGARTYNATIGRFLQPDAIVPGPGNPQALNRYSYVLNNPLRYTDPTGNCIPDMTCNGAWKENEIDPRPTGVSPGAVREAIDSLGLPDPQGLLSNCQRDCDDQGFAWIMRTYKAARVLGRLGDVNMYSWSPEQRHLLGELSFDVDYVVPPSQAQTDAYTLTTALPFAFVGGTFSKALLSTSTTYLYQLVDKTTGQHLKFGISSTPRTRYSQVFMSDKTMRIISSGSRAEMLASERWLVERLPGRLNLEPWAGARYGQFQLFPGFDR